MLTERESNKTKGRGVEQHSSNDSAVEHQFRRRWMVQTRDRGVGLRGLGLGTDTKITTATTTTKQEEIIVSNQIKSNQIQSNQIIQPMNCFCGATKYPSKLLIIVMIKLN